MENLTAQQRNLLTRQKETPIAKIKQQRHVTQLKLNMSFKQLSLKRFFNLGNDNESD